MNLTVIKPGMLTTVQDLGRVGYQGLGVPVSGPMDAYSHRLANQVLGNDPMAAALEITLLGPELVAEGDITCAVAGAEIAFSVDGVSAPRYEPFRVLSGSRIRCGARGKGARATLAVRGGFDLPLTLGSRATHLVSRMGPFGGRALRAGDILPVGAHASADSPVATDSAPPLDLPDGRGSGWFPPRIGNALRTMRGSCSSTRGSPSVRNPTAWAIDSRDQR